MTIGACTIQSPRFADMARFAREFGLSLTSLAEFIARSTTGITPWSASTSLSEGDWRRVDEAIAASREERGDHWAETILSLLNERDKLRSKSEQEPGSPS